MFFLEALSVSDLMRNLDIRDEEKSHGVNSQLVRFDYDRGTLEFISHSSGSKDSWRQHVVLVDWGTLRELLEPAAEQEIEEEEELKKEVIKKEEPKKEPPKKPEPKKPSTKPEPKRIVTPKPKTIVQPPSVSVPKSAPPAAPAPSGPSGLKPLAPVTSPMKSLTPMKTMSSNLHRHAAMSWEQVMFEIETEIKNSDVKVACTCPAYQYWGSHYILDQMDTALPPPENRYPKVRDNELSHTVCKHLVAVFRTFF